MVIFMTINKLIDETGITDKEDLIDYFLFEYFLGNISVDVFEEIRNKVDNHTA